MVEKMRDAERAKAAILGAARRLLAERDFSAVSIRDIAEAAGVSHGLVQHHFGTREQLVTTIVRREVEEFAPESRALVSREGLLNPERLRTEIRAGMERFRDYALLITRAELAGAEPEKQLDPAVPTPAMLLATAIRDLQGEAPAGTAALDPDLVSAYVNASLFAFATMAPWLMTTVGLEPRDYEARLDEIIDISLRLIALAAGAPTKD